MKKTREEPGRGTKIAKKHHETIEVPDGRKVVVRSLVTGIDRRCEPEAEEAL